MDKAILVIDMPKFCSECMFCKKSKSDDFYGFEEESCLFTNYHIHYDTKPENRVCPLKELPKKYEIDRNKCSDPFYQFEFEYGHNQCIDEILGK